MINLRNIESDATFLARLTVSDDGPVRLINTFVTPPGQVEAVIDVRRQDSKIMKAQPGFTSAQLHQDIGGSHVLVNMAGWESASALRAAFHDPRFQALRPLCPDGSVSYPVLSPARRPSRASASPDLLSALFRGDLHVQGPSGDP